VYYNKNDGSPTMNKQWQYDAQFDEENK